MSVFKPCDIRGEYPRELDRGFALRLGRAVGARIEGAPIIVGGDVRIGTEELQAALVEGLVESGCRVVDIGCVPTPVLYFARHDLGIPNAVMVTASHNPPRYNGFKMTFGEMPITEEEMRAVADAVTAGVATARSGGAVARKDVLEGYRQFLRLQFAKDRPMVAKVLGAPAAGGRFKVVVDCGNGCYSGIAPAFLEEQGLEVVPLFCEPDGRFPNRDPNPAVARSLERLRGQVASTRADLGLAFDGDGDRVAFVDAAGRIIESDKVIALFSRVYASARPGARIVYDIKCSRLVPDEIERAGGVALMEKSGHTFIRATLLREKAAFAGEISGHCFFGSFGWDDGLYAALLFIEILRAGGTALADSLPRYHTTPDLRIPCAAEGRQLWLERLADAHSRSADCRVSRLDGVRCDFPQGWGLVRVSVTEPALTFRFEAKQLPDIAVVMDRFLAPVPELEQLVRDYQARHGG